MEKNVGGFDRGIRYVLAAVLLAVGALAPVSTTIRIVLFVLAALAFMTATLRWCALWPLLGINTYRKKEDKGK